MKNFPGKRTVVTTARACAKIKLTIKLKKQRIYETTKQI